MTRIALAVAAVLLVGCGIEPDPPPHFKASDFGGTGYEMARCMQFASQSACEQEIWGGGDVGN
jgi:hypothetical protein